MVLRMFATLRSRPQKSTAAHIAQTRSPASEELSGGRREAAPEPIALRVFETMEDMPQAFYDVTEEAEPRILLSMGI